MNGEKDIVGAAPGRRQRSLAPFFERLPKDKLFSWFAFLSFAAAFSFRLGRDLALFTSLFGEGTWAASMGLRGGANLLGLSFVINAILMTWFAGYYEQRLERAEPEKASQPLIWLVVVGSFVAGVLLLLSLEWAGYKPVLALILFIASEVAIFLFMNMIWIFAADRYTEVEQRQKFPMFMVWGYLGILVPVVVAGGLLFFYRDAANAGVMFGLAGIMALAAVLMLPALGSLTRLKDADSTVQIEHSGKEESRPEEATGKGFWYNFVESVKWARTIRYLWLFVWVTVFNFFLLAFFDQTLASVTAARRMSEVDLLFYLVLATGFFAGSSAVILWRFFRNWLDKYGAEKLNLFAPAAMLLGSLMLAVGLTTWASGSLPPMDRIVIFVVVARLFGWVAEFLFNQSLLPYIYGALPERDENRARLFVEGPVTALTNGTIGLIFLVYVWYFDGWVTTTDLQGDKVVQVAMVRFDVAIAVALILATLMFVLSLQMIPEYRTVLIERLRSGGSIFGGVDSATASFLQEIRKKLVEGWRRLGMANLKAPWASFLHDDDGRDRFRTYLVEHLMREDAEDTLTHKDNAEAIARLAVHFGIDTGLRTPLTQWLDKLKPDVFISVAAILVTAGFEGGLLVKEAADRRIGDRKKPDLTTSARLDIAALLHSEPMARDTIDELARKRGNLASVAAGLRLPERLARFKCSDPLLSVDITALILHRLTSPRNAVSTSLRQEIADRPWLGQLLLRLFFARPDEDWPAELRLARLVAPYLLEGIAWPERITAPETETQMERLLDAWCESRARVFRKAANVFTAVLEVEGAVGAPDTVLQRLFHEYGTDRLENALVFTGFLRLVAAWNASGISEDFARSLWSAYEQQRDRIDTVRLHREWLALAEARLLLTRLDAPQAFVELPDTATLAAALFVTGDDERARYTRDKIQAMLEQELGRDTGLQIAHDIASLAASYRVHMRRPAQEASDVAVLQ